MLRDQLMRDCVSCEYGAAVSGVKNTAFTLDIPDGYAMEIHEVDFILSAGAVPADNRYRFYLVDDPDETADPGHCAEKVIQSTEMQTDAAACTGWYIKTVSCHKTLLVKNPNLIAYIDNVPGATIHLRCRIWFDLIRITKDEAYDLLRQQQY